MCLFKSKMFLVLMKFISAIFFSFIVFAFYDTNLMRKTGGKPRCGGKIEATRVRMVWLRLQTLSVVELGIMEKSPSWKPT